MFSNVFYILGIIWTMYIIVASLEFFRTMNLIDIALILVCYGVGAILKNNEY